jgi:hypothetical protein
VQRYTADDQQVISGYMVNIYYEVSGCYTPVKYCYGDCKSIFSHIRGVAWTNSLAAFVGGILYPIIELLMGVFQLVDRVVGGVLFIAANSLTGVFGIVGGVLGLLLKLLFGKW